jgi:hypothetical protein
MSSFGSPLAPDVASLLGHERDISPVPAAVRARALGRARAALVAGAARSPSRHVVAPRRISWAAAAALVCVGGAAIGAVAYEIRSRLIEPPSAPPAAAPVTRVASKPASSVPPTALVTSELSAPPDTHAVPHLSRADAARAELRLLRQARAAVAREDYAAAMPPIAEHVRRFKGGRLTEEREALRVKALAGLGRTDDAQRAAAAFRARFPRSVLLPAVGRMPAREP